MRAPTFIKRKPTGGFTIIEVMIVLAVASLIMLIVFLAVPALQRSARNSNRTSDASKVAAAVNDCMANRNNTVASCNTDAAINGVTLDTTSLRQLTTVHIGTNAPSPSAFPANNTTVYVYFGEVCGADGSSHSTTNANAQQFVVLYNNETPSGGNSNRCLGS